MRTYRDIEREQSHMWLFALGYALGVLTFIGYVILWG